MEQSKIFEETIKRYLDKRAEEDPFFSDKYRNEKKNIAECCKFIISEVQKMNVIGLSDDEVFGLAVHYYDEENVGEIKDVQCNVVVNHNIELTEEEKQQARIDAREKFIQQEIAKMKKPNVSKQVKKKEEVEFQMSLF